MAKPDPVKDRIIARAFRRSKAEQAALRVMTQLERVRFYARRQCALRDSAARLLLPR